MKGAGLACALGAALVAGAASASGPPSGTVQGRVRVSPLSVAVVVPSDPVKVGKDFRIRAEVTNSGPSALQNVAVTLLAPQTLVLRDPATQALPRVGPAEVRGIRWDVCTTTPGDYVMMSRATAGAFSVESTGQLVQITSAKRPSCG
jgi:hypothetical protein